MMRRWWGIFQDYKISRKILNLWILLIPLKEIAKQLQFDRKEFEDDDPHTKAMVEGFQPGTNVRILLDPTYPVVIVEGLLTTEENLGSYMEIFNV